MGHVCPKCGGTFEAGIATAYGFDVVVRPSIEEPLLQFVVLGSPTSKNPIKAFAQGIADEPSARAFWIEGSRCSVCGFLELFATRETSR
jgi:hypothetical protein